MKKIFFIILTGVLLASACTRKKENPAFITQLYQQTKLEIYKDFDSVVFDSLFRHQLRSEIKEKSTLAIIKTFYKENGCQPLLFQKFYFSGAFYTLIDSLNKASDHGFSPEYFNVAEIEENLKGLTAAKTVTKLAAYQKISRLEVLSAKALVQYITMMEYGAVNPKKILSRFSIPIKLPNDSIKKSILNTDDMVALLKNASPKNPDYWVLQHAYLKQKSLHNKELQSKLLVNMERARWNIPKLNKEHVLVNIPTFELQWIKGDSVLTKMNVCVGMPIDADYDTKMQAYLKTKDLNLRPSNHETSILMSTISTVQVNPVWNIPKSIATREIYLKALNDRFYLANSNIKVYQKGRLIQNPDTIQWFKYKQDKLPFVFKQAPGDGNALGKFKFIFPNNGGLYLHDTNVKSAFQKSDRALSHGCVRIQDPLKFAELLSGNKKLYDRFRIAISLKPIDSTMMKLYEKHELAKTDTLNKFELKATTYKVYNAVQLFITYQTAYVTVDGQLKYAPDVYNMDPKIYQQLRKYLKASKN